MTEYSETLPENKVQGICPLWWLNECYDAVSDDVDKVIARQTGKDHGDMLCSADGYMTAWFMYYLKGETDAGKVFFGEDAEIHSNENLYQQLYQYIVRFATRTKINSSHTSSYTDF